MGRGRYGGRRCEIPKIVILHRAPRRELHRSRGRGGKVWYNDRRACRLLLLLEQELLVQSLLLQLKRLLLEVRLLEMCLLKVRLLKKFLVLLVLLLLLLLMWLLLHRAPASLQHL